MDSCCIHQLFTARFDTPRKTLGCLEVLGSSVSRHDARRCFPALTNVCRLVPTGCHVVSGMRLANHVLVKIGTDATSLLVME